MCAAEPVFIITEDSTAYSTNNLILDGHEFDDSTRMRILTEDSSEAAEQVRQSVERMSFQRIHQHLQMKILDSVKHFRSFLAGKLMTL